MRSPSCRWLAHTREGTQHPRKSWLSFLNGLPGADPEGRFLCHPGFREFSTRRIPRVQHTIATREHIMLTQRDDSDRQIIERYTDQPALMPPAVRRYKDLAIIGEDLVRFLRSASGFSPES